MSLFPAYADEAEKLDDGPVEKPSWLENSSFQIDVDPINKQSTSQHGLSSNSNDNVAQSKKTDKHKAKKQKPNIVPEKKSDNLEVEQVDFVVDVKDVKEYLNVQTIARPSAPKYKAKYKLINIQKGKKRKFKRYFNVISGRSINKSDDEEGPKLTKKTLNETPLTKRDENFTGFDQEEDLSKKTAFYNKGLAENPHDIKLWLEYVDFQDSVYQFEKTYRKGSIAKAQTVLAERKISIIEKALTHNPSSEPLLRERLKVAVGVFPPDQLQAQLKVLVEKEQDNIILWQGYIEATQHSMSHCTTPAVLDLYSQCLSTLHKLRRTTVSEKYLSEESILRMLYQCGLFLKQTGLFEQLWTLLKMYLDLNLNPPDSNKFVVDKTFSETELLELEEVVFKSQLPHHELWLRTEKLRESCHWLPSLDTECVDPQRIVFNEDVAELIHPITMPENMFKLVATIFTLLKIPLIPCRHTTMQDLGLDYVPWSLDSIECLLPAFVSLYPVDTQNENFFKDITRFAVGPQYLKVLPGQEEYLNFILSLIENCADCLTGDDQIAVRIWWFRFQRLLITLDAQGRFKIPPYLKKQIKSGIKNLLKQPEHRNNEIFYVEYALIEKELGNSEQCINILQTALTMNKNKGITTENIQQCQVNQCYLYRTLVEIFIQRDVDSDTTKNKILKNLLTMVLQRNIDTVNNGLLMEANTKFRLITDKLLEGSILSLSPLEQFIPNFVIDWIISNGWFLFFTEGFLKCCTFLETILERLENKSSNLSFQKEVLHEFYCAVLFKHCLDNPGHGTYRILDDVLFRSIAQYPNNIFLLTILAKEQSMVKNLGVSWWKIQNLLLQTERAIAIVFNVLIYDLVKTEIEKETLDTLTGKQIELASYKPRMRSLFKRITKRDMCTRRCGLVWRLYLHFEHNYFDPVSCQNVYYIAVEECPWVKALYMDAAIYIPAELGKIQDLIIEKQLRLHVTPEELDVLRS